MFILSIKTNKKVLWVCACALIVVIVAIVMMVTMGKTATAAMAGPKFNVKVSSNEQRIAFLQQFGWEVTQEPIEISEVTIPQTFNTVYENYNEIQKDQGLNLAKYSGKICKKWVYEITNYPDQTTGVRANLLVLDNQVIGGDISSVALDGFMCGFEGPKDVMDEESESSTPACIKDQKETQAKPAKPTQASQIPKNAWPTD